MYSLLNTVTDFIPIFKRNEVFPMSEKTVVVALGHRALGTTLPEQKTATKLAAKVVADLVGNPRSDLPQQRSAGRDDPHRNE